MALTRKFLKALGLEDEKIEEIISAHSDTVTALKDEIEKYKGDAEKLPGIQAELDKAKQDAEKGEKDTYKVKYEALKEDYDKYKAGITAKETRSAKENAYRDLLKAAGISEKRIDAILRVSDVDAVEIVDGKVKDADKLTASIKTEWADFIGTVTEKGAKVDTPPKTPPTTVEPKSLAEAIKEKMKG